MRSYLVAMRGPLLQDQSVRLSAELKNDDDFPESQHGFRDFCVDIYWIIGCNVGSISPPHAKADP